MDYEKYLDDPILQTEILNNNSNFIIISYFWGRENKNKNSVKGLTYGQQVDRLIGNCRSLNINYCIAEYPIFAQKGLYQIALGLKGHFILRMMEKFSEYNVIFIDSDLQILRYPYLFEIDADCFFLNWNMYDTGCFNPYQLELPGGILGFGKSYNARVMLKILNNYMIHHLHLAEDKSMSGIITRHFMSTYLRCIWVPMNYMYMFEKHEYDPSIGKYTKIVTLEEDLKGEMYEPKDIVMIHEDFETGALDDVFKQKVGKKSRFPPRLDSQLGEKLRCIEVKYLNYINFGLTSEQGEHYAKDFLNNEKREKIYKNVILKPIISTRSFTPLIQGKSDQHDFIITSCIDSTHVTKDELDQFVKRCSQMNLEYYIFDEKDEMINKPELINYMMKNMTKRNIVYMDVHFNITEFPKMFNVKNMDFMTINLNNTTTNINDKRCSDMRILKLHDDTLYYFANNNIVSQLMALWYEHNKQKYINNHFQHKSLEYAFNISLAINKLRCYWLPKYYIMGPVLKYPKELLPKKNTYPNSQMKRLTKKLQQCGIKPPLKNSEPLPVHYYGSVYGNIYHNRYGPLFLEF